MAELPRMRELARKWLNGTITESEKQEFEAWYNNQPDADLQWTTDASEGELKDRLLVTLMEKIDASEEEQQKIYKERKFIFRRVATAAAIIILLAIGTWLFFFNKPHSQPEISKTNLPVNNDVQPGTNGAVLTLDDGRQIILDSANNGLLVQQGRSNVIKQANAISYESNAGDQNNHPNDPIESTIVYNTMSTPKGRQYSLVLADGSKVWLNASSSIKFPTLFAGQERRVEVSGEIYFEVAKNASMPFRVVVNDMTVEVVGTHFNINSYSDESSVTTTLLEGAVNVRNGDKNLKLSPGQQSVLKNNGDLVLNKDINTDEVVAWKNGFFHFESADMKTILRQFARWYDIEVVYDGPATERKFFGIVKRSNTLKKVLEMLEDNNVVYKIEGKKLVVKSS